MKMLVFDLDGTLLSEDKMVSQKTFNYLKEVRKKDIRLSLPQEE